MKKRYLVIIFTFLICISTNNTFAEKNSHVNHDNVVYQIERVTREMVGADAIRLVQMSDDYFILEDYHGILIFEQLTGRPLRVIAAQDLNLDTQGDRAFEYKLEGDILYLKSAVEGSSYQYNIRDGSLTVCDHEIDFSLQQKRMENLENFHLPKNASSPYGLKTEKTFTLCYFSEEFNNPFFILGTNDGCFLQILRLSDTIDRPKNPEVLRNGKKISELVRMNGLWYLPLRQVTENLDFEVTWNSMNHEIGIKKGRDSDVVITSDGLYLSNDKTGDLMATPFIKNDSTYVTLDYLIKVLEYKAYLDIPKGILEIK